jgi:hypothetical protein
MAGIIGCAPGRRNPQPIPVKSLSYALEPRSRRVPRATSLFMGLRHCPGVTGFRRRADIDGFYNARIPRRTRSTSLRCNQDWLQHNHGRNRLSRSQPGCSNKPRQVCDAWYLRRPHSHLSSRRHLWGRWRHPGVAHPDRQITGMEGSLEENQRILFALGRAKGGIDFHRGALSMIAHKFFPNFLQFTYQYVVGL